MSHIFEMLRAIRIINQNCIGTKMCSIRELGNSKGAFLRRPNFITF